MSALGIAAISAFGAAVLASPASASYPVPFTIDTTPPNSENDPAMTGAPLTSTQLFDCIGPSHDGPLNLNLPGLSKVQTDACVTHNLAQARIDLLAYYEGRSNPSILPAAGSASTDKACVSNADTPNATDSSAHNLYSLGGPSTRFQYGPDPSVTGYWYPVQGGPDSFPPNSPDKGLWVANLWEGWSWARPLSTCFDGNPTDPSASTWAQEYVTLVDGWLKNPDMVLATPNLGAGGPAGVLPWYPFLQTMRAHYFAESILPFLRAKSPAITPEFFARFLANLYNQEWAIYQDHEIARDANFSLQEDAPEFEVATIFPEFSDSGTWRNDALPRLNEDAGSTDNVFWTADGWHDELTPTYHTLFAQLLLSAAIADQKYPCSSCGHPDDTVATRGEQAATNIVDMSTPVDARSQFAVGDSQHDGEEPRLLAGLGYKYDGTRADLKSYYDGANPLTLTQLNYGFSTAGFYAFRNNWTTNATYLGLENSPGPFGPNAGFHSHFDRGTFELAAFGRHLMRDPGYYLYGNPDGSDNADRALFQSSAYHDTVTIGANAADTGLPPNATDTPGLPPHGSLLQFNGNASTPNLTVANPMDATGLTDRRTVFFLGQKYFAIVDDIIGSATGPLKLHFQLTPDNPPADPDISVNASTWSAHTMYPTGGNVLVVGQSDTAVTLAAPPSTCIKPPTGETCTSGFHQWYSPVAGQYQQQGALSYNMTKGSSDVRYVTIIAPYSGSGDSPPAVSSISASGTIGDCTLMVSATIAGTNYSGSRTLPPC